MNRRAFLLSSLALLALPQDADARAGGGQHYRSSSRSSSSRSSSSRSSSSRSSSSRSSSSSSTRYSGSRPYSGGGSSHSSTGEGLFLFLVFLGVVGFALMHILNSAERSYAPPLDLDDGLSPRPRPKPVDLSALKAADPDFNEAAFKAWAAEAFVAIQQHWSAQNMGPARRFISDGVFNRFETYLDLDRLRRRHNVVSNVEVINNQIAAVSQAGGYDMITLRMTASLHDRTVSLQNGRTLSAKDDLFTEYWSFMRRRGVKSRAERFSDPGCPSCGAPLDINQTAKCTHCGALVNSGEYDWVLAEISQDIPNATDENVAPGVPLQLLEDRASVAVWAMIDAAMRGQPQRARRLVAPRVLAAMEEAVARGKWTAAVDVGIGALRTVEYAQVAGDEVATLELDWSGTRFRAPDGLGRSEVPFSEVTRIRMKRSGGAGARRGLATAGCPSCGGPLERTVQSACPWCQSSLDAADGDWLLIDGPAQLFRPVS